MGENAGAEQHRLVTNADLDASLDRQIAMLKNWMLKLVLAQTALILTIAVGAVVVAGLLWG